MNIRHEKIASAYKIRIKADWMRTVPHWHQRTKIALVLKSCFSVTIQGRNYIAKPGDLLVIRRGEIHHLQAMEQEAAMGLCIFSPTLLSISHTGIFFVHNHALNYSGKVSAVVHFGNPYALQPLNHIKRKIFGYMMPQSQLYAIEVLAGKLSAQGKLPFQVDFS